jgi:signal recognition particle subunit SRP68
MEMQQQHGLRPDNDYLKYRQYVTNRLRRIRSLANFKYGKGRGFVQHELTLENVCEKPNLLMIPLLNAERAWSYAMHIKQELEVAKAGHGKLTSHLFARLKKAAAYGAEFEKLCLAMPADARTCLESTAYASWLKGNLYLEQENWMSALEFYSSALTIVQQLGTVGTIEQRDLFCSRAESIEQALRYCKYNLSENHDISELGDSLSDNKGDFIKNKLESVLEKARREQALSLEQVSWRGKTINVRQDEVRSIFYMFSSWVFNMFKLCFLSVRFYLFIF